MAQREDEGQVRDEGAEYLFEGDQVPFDEDDEGQLDLDDLDDLDDSDDDDDDDDDYDDYEDASAEDIDFVVGLYREDGAPVVIELPLTCANDLDEMIRDLRRLPGDAGAIGITSIAGDLFVITRVRGHAVQVMLSDAVAAQDWPIARDVLDFLGEDLSDYEDDSEPIGDFAIVADQGVSEFDVEAIAGNYDEDADELVRDLVHRMKFGAEFDKVVD